MKFELAYLFLETTLVATFLGAAFARLPGWAADYFPLFDILLSTILVVSGSAAVGGLFLRQVGER